VRSSSMPVRSTPLPLWVAYFVAIVATIYAALALAPVRAEAWTATKSSNGVVVLREDSDLSTTTVSITLYYDYKGGDTWVSGTPASSAASYQSSILLLNTAASFDVFEVPLVDAYRCQMVAVGQGGQATRYLAVLNDRLRVSLPATQSIVVSDLPSVAVSSMPSLTLDSSVSVDGTLPVTVTSLPEDYLVGVWFVVFAVGVGVVVVWRRLS